MTEAATIFQPIMAQWRSIWQFLTASPSGESLGRQLTSSSPASAMAKYQWGKSKWMQSIFVLASQAAFLWFFFRLLQRMDPSRQSATDDSHLVQGRTKAALALKNAHGKNKKLRLSHEEETIAQEIVLPEDISTHFSDIGGLEELHAHLKEAIILPLKFPQYFEKANALLTAPKGILLYGPPGCGKTMTARALAKECGATFINLQPDSLQSKWYGQTNKLVAALFSLAQKLAPTIIFIDEIDALLRARQTSDHEVSAMLKAAFMTFWDGLDEVKGVVIMGSTNRIHDVDDAILRRLPRRFEIKMPDEASRFLILTKLLKGQTLSASFQLNQLAHITAGFSGSDLKDLCQTAALRVVREYIHLSGTTEEHLATLNEKQQSSTDHALPLRPLTMMDFLSTDTLKKRYPNPHVFLNPPH